jgi:uncharacterized membrane protein
VSQATERTVRDVFVGSILLKGAFGLFEVVSGLALALVSAETISTVGLLVAHWEMAHHPFDLVAGMFRRAAESVSISAKSFAALYLFLHGALKIVLVVALLRDRDWAYPASLVIFAGFVAYQVYRFTFTGSVMLVLLTVFDLFIMALIWHEWRDRAARRSRKAA